MPLLTPDSCKLCRFVADSAAQYSANRMTDGLGPLTPNTGGTGLGTPRLTVAGEVQPVAFSEDDYWVAALNENQATLGRVYFVLKRHETDIAQLTVEEQASLWRQVAAVKAGLSTLFEPDHFNYMFLMNLVGHAHFHIYPRYAGPRTFAGLTFTDPHFGGHYDPAAERRLEDGVRDSLVEALRAQVNRE